VQHRHQIRAEQYDIVVEALRHGARGWVSVQPEQAVVLEDEQAVPVRH
jgi:hypothetical protein